MFARIWKLGPAPLLVCIASQAPGQAPSAPNSGQKITYISSDLRHVAIFSAESARFGPRLALSEDWPSSPARYLQLHDGVQCVSVGRPGNTDEFAVKRPIRIGERYACLSTFFKVTHCYEGCQAAVIQRVSKLGANRAGTLKDYMYVDRCLGVLAFSSSEDLRKGIPPYGPWLRGTVGILADRDARPRGSEAIRYSCE